MDSQDGRRAFAIGALLLLGICAGMGAREWLASREQPPLARAPAGETVFGTRLSDQAARVWAELLSAVDARGGGRFTFQRLAALLSRRKADPAARAFAEEFMKDPELEQVWREFVVSERGSDTAWLARKLSDSSRFAKLLNKHSQDRRFLALMQSLTAEARAENAEAPTADPVAPFAGGGQAPARAAGSKPGAAPGLLAWGGRPGAGLAGPQGQAGAANGGGIVGGEPTPVLEERAAPMDEKAIIKTSRGEKGPEALKLAELKTAGPSQDLNPWASLCYRENEAISRDECSAINQHLGEDALWNACLKANLLDRCVTLCQDLPQLRCAEQATALKACRETYSAEQCAHACSAGPDCRVGEEPPADPPPDNGEGRTDPVPMEAVMDGLRDLWATAGGGEEDWPQFNGTLDLVRAKFNPPPDVMATFRQKLQQIIQNSPTCNDACEMQRTAELVRETFGGQSGQ